MENNTVSNSLPSAPLSELIAYHQQLMDKYSESPKVQTPSNSDTPKLMPLNGYYTLGNAPGAFFAVDTNMIVLPTSPVPVYDLSLIISLDGKTATRFAFTGTFDGIQLIQHWQVGGLNINLNFTRTDKTYGPVAKCSGSITLPGQSAVAVSGSTYNNPIPTSLFIGNYYYTTPSGGAMVKVMSIGKNNELLYDYGSNNGVLKPVSKYVYNLNMYFFSTMQETESVSLIMGTASVNGFACNNMTVGTSLISRSLLTLPKSIPPVLELYDLSNCTLADFSGYYQIPIQNAPLAFVSIQSQYVTLIQGTSLDLYFVLISISLDGNTSQGYYYNPFTMSFDGETLNMPEQGITLKLTREYNASNGSLVSLSGTVNGTKVSGCTLFNPVPLSVFGGVPMTNDKGDTLTVTNDNRVTYNGIKMDSIIYVPLMYILAYPVSNSTTVMSFGTDGTSGNTCIVFQNPGSEQKTSVVYAIPKKQ